MKISVITPVWNRADVTVQFLQWNWQMYHNRPEIEFIVVDNGSTDSTPMILNSWKRQMKDQLQILRNEVNLGFGPGNNQGAEIARADTQILLSNDVIPTGDYITPVSETVRENPTALVGAQLLDFDTGWNKFDGEIIPYLGGWCLACTRKVWADLGGFDERYIPCDYEDLDLSRTAASKNIPLVPVDLPLRHAFGQSARNLKGGRLEITLKNKKLFMEKWNYGNAE